MWSIERTGAPASRVNLLVTEGDIEVEFTQGTGVFEALDGSRTVWSSPRRPANVRVPDLWFSSRTELSRLEQLCTSGAKLTLRADTGQQWTVRAVGGFRYRILDTAGRSGTSAVFLATIELIGV